MTNEELDKVAIAYRELMGIIKGFGGSDEDAYLTAGVAKAIIMSAPKDASPDTAVERVQRINGYAGEAERLFRQVRDKGQGLNGEGAE